MKARRRRDRVVKIAVSLPSSLYQAIEKERRETGQSRSAIVRSALEDSIARRDRAALIERYVEGYRKHPETVAEVAAAESASADALAGESWE